MKNFDLQESCHFRNSRVLSQLLQLRQKLRPNSTPFVTVRNMPVLQAEELSAPNPQEETTLTLGSPKSRLFSMSEDEGST
jgi:hypothetical protein